MALIDRSLRLVLLVLAFAGLVSEVPAKDGSSIAASGAPDLTNSRLYGPGDVYANIPVKDEYGRDQLAMFRGACDNFASATPHLPTDWPCLLLRHAWQQNPLTQKKGR